MDERLDLLKEHLGGAARQAGAFVSHAAAALGGCAAEAVRSARHKLRQADARAEIHLRMRELGELLYATHTGTPTESGVLRRKMEQIDALRQELADAEGAAARRCPSCGAAAAEDARFCKECGGKL